MKYIDADLLKKEIERRITDNTFGAKLELIDILAWLDSLQQEQQDFPITDEQMKVFLATHPKVEIPDKYKTPDWLFKKQEQQEVDLEKEIEEYWIATEWSKVITLGKFKVIARYFYGLGQLNSK